MRLLKRLLFLSLIFFIVFATGAAIYTYSQINKIENVRISKSNEDLGINIEQLDFTVPESFNEEIKSIALFGIDSGREKYEVPRSDSIIIATVDPKRKKIKLTSIMRDTYVKIKGHGRSKICEAYAYGGPQLAVRTINENFNLNVRDYITVDFFELEKVIDALGGVKIDVKSSEIKELNYRIEEAAFMEHKSPSVLRTGGVQNLNGIQAVAYCRIRKTGSGDFERTSRQRLVLNELINKTRNEGLIRFPMLTLQIFPMLQTSMSNSDILKLGRQVIATGITEVEQQRFPQDGYCKGEIINGIWYLSPKPSLDATKEQISKYIFEDIKPQPKQPLF